MIITVGIAAADVITLAHSRPDMIRWRSAMTLN